MKSEAPLYPLAEALINQANRKVDHDTRVMCHVFFAVKWEQEWKDRKPA